MKSINNKSINFNVILKKIAFALILVLCCVNMQCDKESEEEPLKPCDQITIVDKTIYNDLDSAHFTIVNAEINDDCLLMELSASGCDGKSWEFNLVDSEVVAESFPEQRYLKFQLINTEVCQAVFKRTVSFDLKPVRVEGSREIILHIEGLEPALQYKY